VRIVDMRTEEVYRKGHLPGAVHLERKTLKDADHEVYVIPPDKLAPLMSALGIGNDTTVVGYDDQGCWGITRYATMMVRGRNGGIGQICLSPASETTGS
jgi:3-mercaptopyruvate sulfurtransferase SseA